MITKIHEVVSKVSNIPFDKVKSINPKESIFSEGLRLDSFKAIELVFELESTFNVQFEDNEISIKNFDSFEKIEKTLEKKIN